MLKQKTVSNNIAPSMAVTGMSANAVPEFSHNLTVSYEFYYFHRFFLITREVLEHFCIFPSMRLFVFLKWWNTVSDFHNIVLDCVWIE